MTDTEIGLATTLLTAAGGSLAVVTRWAVGLWATVRREDIAAAKESARLKREADERNIDRQIETIDRISAKVDSHTAQDIAAQADVKQTIVRFDSKLDAILAMRERPTPIEMQAVDIDGAVSERRRARTAPRGYRAPKPGAPDDH